MIDSSISRTVSAGGSISEETTLFDENCRRIFLQINVIGAGELFCSIGTADAEAGSGIYIDSTNPLCLQMPASGEVHVIPSGSSAVVYSAAEGLS